MNFFISVISHGHGEIIKNLNCLSFLNQKYRVVIKNNTLDPILIQYAKENNIEVINEKYDLGFGANNNLVYSYLEDDIKPDDYFLILNPDVYLELSELDKLSKIISDKKEKAYCINLFNDSNHTIFDNSIRRFPSFFDFVYSLLFKINNTILHRDKITSPTIVDWAAGSFLLINSGAYKDLNGFDENYFMYCEDIDICFRLKFLLKENLIYLPNVKATHLAKHANRKIFSKHFYWHIKSSLLFILKKRAIKKTKD